METDTVVELVTRALAASRAAIDADDPDGRHECVPLLWQAAADGAAALPLGTLGVDAAFGSSGYDMEALLARADGNPARAAELVATDLPGTLPDSPAPPLGS